MMRLHLANPNEYQAVRSFYNELIDKMETADFKPGWEKGIYPADQFLENAIENQQLYVVTLNNNYAGAMVINHESNDCYDKINWRVEASKNNILIIHVLGVLPKYHGKGIAKYLIQKAIKLFYEVTGLTDFLLYELYCKLLSKVQSQIFTFGFVLCIMCKYIPSSQSHLLTSAPA